MYGPTSLIVTAIIFPLLGVIAVCLRFYVRLRLKPTFVGVDDWMITFSCLLVCASGANQIVGATIGNMGRVAGPVEPHRVYVQSKCNYAILISEKVTYSCIKISVLLFYRRIFTTPAFRRINTLLIFLMASWGVAFLFSEAFLCGSTSRGGDPCPSIEWRVLWFAITDVVGDIAVLIMPYPMIKQLHMCRREKVGVCGIFLLGTLSVIAGVVRLGFVSQRFVLYFHPSKTSTRLNAAPQFWTTFEISVGVLAACLPPLGPLIRRMPSPSHLFEPVMVNLGFRSNRAGPTRIVPELMQTPNVKCINDQDRKTFETAAAEITSAYERMDNSRQTSEV